MLCCWLGMGMGVPTWDGFPGPPHQRTEMLLFLP